MQTASKVGNYGEVMEVRHKLLNKSYAVKILEKNHQNLLYFENELKILRELDHPNVVKFIEIFVSKEKMFLIMDYYSGNTLKEYIKNIKNIDEYQMKKYLY